MSTSQSSANEKDTKERLLSAALELFAESGFDGVSLRDLTAAAGANLGAVGYHFGSKDGLIEAVFERLATPVNQSRLAHLEAYERAVSATGPSVEGVLRALVEPAVRFAKDSSGDGVYYSRILDIAYALRPPAFTKLMRDQYDQVALRFIDALADALPRMPREAIVWRYVFAIGAMLHIVDDANHGNRVGRFSDGLGDSTDADQIIDRLIPFLVGGIGGDRRVPSIAPRRAAGNRHAAASSSIV